MKPQSERTTKDFLMDNSTQCLKWGGARGAQPPSPPAPIWAPCNSVSPLIESIDKVLFYA